MRDFIPLVAKWAEKYLHNPGVIKSHLANSPAAREIGRCAYHTCVNYQELEPIENLEQLEKKRIWETAKRWAELSKEETMSLAKTLYLMENMIQKPIE